jgi:F0F1-type ATP synthase epsilon subunit
VNAKTNKRPVMIGKILWEFKEYVVIGVLLAALGAGTVYHNIRVDLLEQELKNEKTAAALMKETYTKEVERWEEQLTAQINALKKSKKEKEDIIQKNRKSFDELYKRFSQNEQKLRTALAAALNGADIVVPRKFIGLYNAAVANRPDSSDVDGGAVEVSPDSTRVLAEVATFDAVAFSEVVIGNVLEYHRLAQRCDALVDIVIDLEASNERANPQRVDGAPSANGGNPISRVVRDNIF